MTEILISYEDEVRASDDTAYRARAVGQERDGLWDGWLEFEAERGTVHTGRETTQPNRDAVFYWATGLTNTYLEGALARALSPAPQHVADWETPQLRHAAPADATQARTIPAATAVLNPFAVHAEGARLLRDQLGALDADHLRNIIIAHDLADAANEELAALTEWELRALIIQAVEHRSQ
jgi:hypothetical protein